MRQGTHPVYVREKQADGKKARKHVGNAEFPIYDSTDEAIEGQGEARALELLNAQIRTNALNNLRALQRPGGAPSMKALRTEALGRITGEEWVSIAGDPVKIEAKILEKIDEIKAEKGIEDDDSND